MACGSKPAEATIRLWGAVLAVIVPGAWQAASAEVPQLTMIGLGAGTTCAQWMATARDDDALEQWAFGFASAIAAGVQMQGGTDPLATLDAAAIHAWLGDHCRLRPDGPLSVALVRLVTSGGR